MHQIGDEYEVRSVFSLKPLMDFWTNILAPSDPFFQSMLEELRKDLQNAPELLGPINDRSVLNAHESLVRKLMSPVFPPAFWNTEMFGAIAPFTLRPLFFSPLFQRLLLKEDGSFQGRLVLDWDRFCQARLIKSSLLILRKLYNVEGHLEHPLIMAVEDPETGLESNFRLNADSRFVEVSPVGEIKKLSDNEIDAIMDNFTDVDMLRRFLPPEEFRFHGFTVVRASDVTQSQVISYLEKSLIDKQTIFSPDGFLGLQDQLRILFKLPDLVAGLATIQKDQALILNSGCKNACECIFTSSVHLPLREFAGSLFERSVKESRIIRINDLREEANLTRVEEEFLKGGIRSLLIAPLYYQDAPIGMLSLGSMRPGKLDPSAELLANQITPLFSMAMNRALDELDNRVQAIIKEKCTAVHPAVEWMFRKNVLRHLERLRDGQASELDPIVFRDVYPLYAAADIRGSSEARSSAIQQDMAQHLELAADVLASAIEAKPLPMLQELAHRVDAARRNIGYGLGSSDETTAIYLMRKEIEPLFSFFQGLGPNPACAVEAYEAAMDPNLRTVYRKRKEFEDSVACLNERISAYVDREEAEMQAVIPHYFNKHQTDGLDYTVYLGASMLEKAEFNEIYIKNLRLWQLMLSCGIAWHAHRVKPMLKVPLELTHLILVNNSPISVRFRFDEKRFDVDGAYDVGHEIVRSRIDKAMVKGSDERVTQPGKIAIIYSRIQEADEMRRHIDFLISSEHLLNDVEILDVEDLPGVQGLKAFRVGINLVSGSLAERCERVARA